METVRCIFHADMGHGSGSPFPPGSGAASARSLVAQHKVYTHGRSERHFPQVFTSGRNKFKKTSDKYGRENIYMQLDNTDKIQGFYMNPDENPNNLAKWFMETFNYYKSSLTKKF